MKKLAITLVTASLAGCLNGNVDTVEADKVEVDKVVVDKVEVNIPEVKVPEIKVPEIKFPELKLPKIDWENNKDTKKGPLFHSDIVFLDGKANDSITIENTARIVSYTTYSYTQLFSSAVKDVFASDTMDFAHQLHNTKGKSKSIKLNDGQTIEVKLTKYVSSIAYELEFSSKVFQSGALDLNILESGDKIDTYDASVNGSVKFVVSNSILGNKKAVLDINGKQYVASENPLTNHYEYDNGNKRITLSYDSNSRLVSYKNGSNIKLYSYNQSDNTLS